MFMLYPEVKPFRTQRLKVDQLHELYLEESGNPNGLPVLFLHGGPGGGCESYHRRFFDPEVYRVILFDQRGCGRSTPHGELRDNNTDALVSDIEAIRVELGIEKWVVFGGSWGSTLALVYAEAHPEQVMTLILRGIFLCRDQDIEWFYQRGADRIFPDYWEEFVAPIAECERDNIVAAYYRILTGDNELARMSAAKAWSHWEGRCATLKHNQGVEDHFVDPHFATALARIEAHYFVNQAFLQPNQIIEDAGRLEGIPGIIVHGRYDMICPPDNCWALARAWPEAELQIVREAGHSATDPGILDALVRATRTTAVQLGYELSR